MQDETTRALTPRPIEWTDEAVARLWDYYSRTPSYFADRYGARILRESGLSLSRPYQVLDFGCGPGYIWKHLASRRASWQYTGLDFSGKSIETLRSHAEGHPGFAGAALVDSLPTPFPDDSFDVILLLEVIEHLDDARLQGTLRECHRLLKPGGYFVVTTPNEEDLDACTKFCPNCGVTFHEWQHVRSWSGESLSASLSAVGFRAERIRTLDFSAHGLRGMLVRLGRRWLVGIDKDPHLLGVFRK